MNATIERINSNKNISLIFLMMIVLNSVENINCFEKECKPNETCNNQNDC